MKSQASCISSPRPTPPYPFFTPTTGREEKRGDKKEREMGFHIQTTYMASVDALIGVSQKDELDLLKIKTFGSNVADISEGSNQDLGLVSGDLITVKDTNWHEHHENEYTLSVSSRTCRHGAHKK